MWGFDSLDVDQTLRKCVKTNPRVVFGSIYAAEVKPTPTERWERSKLRFLLQIPSQERQSAIGNYNRNQWKSMGNSVFRAPFRVWEVFSELKTRRSHLGRPSTHIVRTRNRYSGWWGRNRYESFFSASSRHFPSGPYQANPTAFAKMGHQKSKGVEGRIDFFVKKNMNLH